METNFFDSQLLCDLAGDSASNFFLLWLYLPEAVCERIADGGLGRGQIVHFTYADRYDGAK
ncbi:hypothetical protein D3C73_1546170 [compost metagenome]